MDDDDTCDLCEMHLRKDKVDDVLAHLWTLVLNDFMKYHHGNQIRFLNYLVIMKTGGRMEKSTGLKITNQAWFYASSKQTVLKCKIAGNISLCSKERMVV